MIRHIIIIAVFCGTINGFPGWAAGKNTHPGAASKDQVVDIKLIQNHMVVLDLSRSYVPSPSIESYFKYYGINFTSARHFFGYFTSRGRRISAHVWVPRHTRGTLFLLHGYLDHAAILKHLIQEAVEQGFAVAVFDLPGHGLSSGERVAIDDFSEYVETFDDFIERYAPKLPEPYYLVGHSTGCAIAFTFLQQHQEKVFERVVFLAPLLHHAKWRLSKLGVAAAGLFVDTLPRMHRKNSSDTEFLDFVQKDMLQEKRVSIKFLNALYLWEKSTRQSGPISNFVLLIQGTDDTIVDWRYNIPFLKDNIKGVNVVLVDGARHQLANESIALRSKVFKMIFEYIRQ